MNFKKFISKSILLGIFLTPLSSFSNESHVYLGVQGGWSYLSAMGKAYGQNGGAPSGMDINMKKASFVGGLIGGYYTRLENVCVGEFSDFFFMTEFSAKTTDSRAERTGLSMADGSGAAPYENFSVKLKRDYTLGLAAKFGKFIEKNWGPYVTLGILNSRFKATFIDNMERSHTDKRTAWGIAPGVGLLLKLTERMPLRLEYSYEMYQNFKTKNLATTGIFNLRPQPEYHSFMVSLSYLL